METRFSHLYQRDSSVSMLRVKMSRRRSQSQKENRDRTVNQRRRLDKLPELESSVLEMSVSCQPAVLQKQTKKTNSAVEDRKQMLARYKEAKELQKEKERREKEKKGIFKVGLYKPQPLATLSQVSILPSRIKAQVPAQSTRVTRSMKQQQDQKMNQPVAQKTAIVSVSKKVEPAVLRTSSRVTTKAQTSPTASRGKATAGQSTVHVPTTRSVSSQQTASAMKKPLPVDGTLGGPTTRAAAKQLAEPSKSRGKSVLSGKNETRSEMKKQKPAIQDKVKASAEPEQISREGMKEKTEANELLAQPSFAPNDFVFQAPVGLKCFQSVPLTPRSADAFLTPSGVPPPLSFSPMFPQPCAEPPAPSPHPHTPPPAPQLPLSTASSEEAQHDVAYFRTIMASETDRLTQLCEQWDVRTEDISIPEEMRDRMRTAVGQARLLMKERFEQFGGLVDDCDLGRGEKITTCTDLQGFWDMVYFQVEDVTKKFDALKEAESRGWQDEPKPQPRPKRNMRKPPTAAAGVKGVKEGGATAAAKSRLAAVKAAMRAKQATSDANDDVSATSAGNPAEVLVFHGGFFKVESPAKLPGPLRRSSRLSAASSPHHSSCITPKLTTPASSRCSTTISWLALTPTQQATASPFPACTQSTRTPKPTHTADVGSNDRLCSSSIQEPNECPVMQLAGDNRQSVSSVPLELNPKRVEAHSEASSVASALETNCGQSLVGKMQVLCHAGKEDAPGQFDATAKECPLTGQNSILFLSPCPKADSSHPSGHQLSFTLSPCPSEAAPTEHGPVAPTELSPSLKEPQQPSAHTVTISTPPPFSSANSANMDMISSISTSCTEDAPGLDFERYLRPALRSSLSPQLSDTAGASPMSIDVLEEGPVPWLGEQPAGDPLTHMGALRDVSSLGPVFTQQFDTVTDSGLVPFTPEQRIKVRPSVCERDLMTFTPPSKR